MIDIPKLALSLKQPWAWAVFEPTVDKDIENRSWHTSVTGPILIASSAQVTTREYEVASDYIENLTGVRPPLKSELPMGCVLGRVFVHPVLRKTSCPIVRWHMADHYGLPLSQKAVLETPIPCKGLQRFWRVGRDQALVAALAKAKLRRVGA